MTKRHKDFGGSEETYEDLSFTIHGEEFVCYPQVQGVSLLGFVKEAASGDGGRASEALLGFFERVMEPSEFARFDVLWNDPKKVITIDKISAIAEWLTEQYTERPTQAQSSSTSGPKRPGRTQTVKRSSKAATSRD